jgi:hypothetical protein
MWTLCPHCAAKIFHGSNSVLPCKGALKRTQLSCLIMLCNIFKSIIKSRDQLGMKILQGLQFMQCGHGFSSVVWSHTWPGPQPNVIAMNFYPCGLLTHNKNKITQQLWPFGVSWSPGFVLSLPPRGGFSKESKWPWNMIHSMSCMNICRLYIHLAFTHSSGPSSVVWSKLGPAPPFPPMRVLGVDWSWALSLMCEVALSEPHMNQSIQPIWGWGVSHHVAKLVLWRLRGSLPSMERRGAKTTSTVDDIHNIIQIHNGVLWDSLYHVKYSSYSILK